jgi:hypothetical protein
MPPRDFGDCGLRPRADGVEDIKPDVLMGIVVAAVALQRQHLVLHESAHPQAQVVQFRRQGEIHGGSRAVGRRQS